MNDLQPVSDGDLLKKLQVVAKSIVNDMKNNPWDINLTMVREKKWVVVPVERGGLIQEEEADRVAKAVRSMGHSLCFAIATEDIGEAPYCYEVEATREGFVAFSQECSGLNFVVTSENCDFALHYTSEDYNTIAGPVVFVEECLGMDIQSARELFLEFVSGWDMEEILRDMAEQYIAVSS